MLGEFPVATLIGLHLNGAPNFHVNTMEALALCNFEIAKTGLNAR